MRAVATRLAAVLGAAAALLVPCLPAWADRPDDAGPPPDSERSDPQPDRGKDDPSGSDPEAFAPAPAPPPQVEPELPREPRPDRAERPRRERDRSRPRKAAPQPSPPPAAPRNAPDAPAPEPAAPRPDRHDAGGSAERPSGRSGCDRDDLRRGEGLISLEAICKGEQPGGGLPGRAAASAGGGSVPGIAALGALGLITVVGLRLLALRSRNPR